MRKNEGMVEGPNSFVPLWVAFPTMRIVVGPCRSSQQIPQIPHVLLPTGIEWPGVHAADFLTNRRRHFDGSGALGSYCWRVRSGSVRHFSCDEAAARRWSVGFLDCSPPSPHWLSPPRNGSREIPQRDAGRVFAPVLGGFTASWATPMGYDFTSLRTGGLDG